MESPRPQAGSVNAGDPPWFHDDPRWLSRFEGRDDAAWDDLGIDLNMLPPGKPRAMHHEEPGQRVFSCSAERAC